MREWKDKKKQTCERGKDCKEEIMTQANRLRIKKIRIEYQ